MSINLHAAECTCGGLQPILDHFHSEQVMQFLMGLNDQFTQVRAQILLMEPIPSINRVFSLVIQKERQRSIGSSLDNNTDAQLAFATKVAPQKDKGQKKDRPISAHCGIPGHTIDKCFEIYILLDITLRTNRFLNTLQIKLWFKILLFLKLMLLFLCTSISNS